MKSGLWGVFLGLGMITAGWASEGEPMPLGGIGTFGIENVETQTVEANRLNVKDNKDLKSRKNTSAEIEKKRGEEEGLDMIPKGISNSGGWK